MPIQQIDLADSRQVIRFLQVPFRIYKDIPQWVPPIAADARRMLDRRRNPYYRHSQAAFFISQTEDQAAGGRLAVLNNTRYNDFNHEKTAFFFLFECEQDQAAADGLFEAGFAWARQQGLTQIIGPKGFSALDGLGLLVKGFEYHPALGIPYNPAYYTGLLEGTGFTAASEMISGYLTNKKLVLPEKVRLVAERVQQQRGLSVTCFKTRNDLRRLIPRLKDLYNGALEGTTGNVPLTDEEAGSMANQILWFADPELIKIICKDNEPVGFLFAYPDISAALQRTKGRLFPFGWISILLELRRTKIVNVNGAGIIERYRGLGGTALLFNEMIKTLTESRFEQGEIVQIGTDNERMLLELRNFGIDFYKTHRMYQRSL